MKNMINVLLNVIELKFVKDLLKINVNKIKDVKKDVEKDLKRKNNKNKEKNVKKNIVHLLNFVLVINLCLCNVKKKLNVKKIVKINNLI